MKPDSAFQHTKDPHSDPKLLLNTMGTLPKQAGSWVGRHAGSPPPTPFSPSNSLVKPSDC